LRLSQQILILQNLFEFGQNRFNQEFSKFLKKNFQKKFLKKIFNFLITNF